MSKLGLTCTFYNNVSDTNVINKKLLTLSDNVASLTYDNIYDLDTTKPYIKIAYNSTNSYIKFTRGGYNYANLINKYYYVTDVKLKSGFLYIYLKTDVLMTYKEKILASKQLIAQSENHFNRYLNDENYKALNYNRVQFKKFPNGFTSNYKYILLVGGGR